MGRYTVFSTKDVDSQIDVYLSMIVNSIVSIVGKDKIKAVVLFGSFGRGEGGGVCQNGKVIPVNDFDITIFIKKNLIKCRKLFSEILEEKAQELSKIIGIKQIDLDLSLPITLLFSTKNNASYEKYYGHKVLYGAINIKQWMRKPIASQLDLIDGANFFLNRGSGLILAYYSLLISNHETSQIIKENIAIEINKAVLAMGDSYLIMKGYYHYSYSKRLMIAKDIEFLVPSLGATIRELYIESLIWKLQPNFTDIGVKNNKERIITIKNIFSTYFLWFESKRHTQIFLNWKDYSQSIIKLQSSNWNIQIRKIVLQILKNPTYILNIDATRELLKNDFGIKLAIMSSILFSLKTVNSVDSMLLNIASNTITKYYNNVEGERDWCNVSKDYLVIYHPKGIINYIMQKKKKSKTTISN